VNAFFLPEKVLRKNILLTKGYSELKATKKANTDLKVSGHKRKKEILEYIIYKHIQRVYNISFQIQ